MTSNKPKIEVENVNTTGKTSRVDAVKYLEMKSAFLKVLPDDAPGLNQKEILAEVKKLLSEEIFPEGKTLEGKTLGWWSKTVQLDLEAKGLVVRENSKPLRWYKR